MGKRLIVTEQEINHIRGKYGLINEQKEPYEIVNYLRSLDFPPTKGKASDYSNFSMGWDKNGYSISIIYTNSGYDLLSVSVVSNKYSAEKCLKLKKGEPIIKKYNPDTTAPIYIEQRTPKGGVPGWCSIGGIFRNNKKITTIKWDTLIRELLNFV